MQNNITNIIVVPALTENNHVRYKMKGILIKYSLKYWGDQTLT